MRIIRVVVAISALLLCAPGLRADGTKVISVDPDTAKAGDVISVTGEGMGSTNVDALYLTNDSEDFQVQVIEQQEKLIKFKVPSGVKAGPWSLMLRTKGTEPKLLEQPFKITVQ